MHRGISPKSIVCGGVFRACAMRWMRTAKRGHHECPADFLYPWGLCRWLDMMTIEFVCGGRKIRQSEHDGDVHSPTYLLDSTHSRMSCKESSAARFPQVKNRGATWKTACEAFWTTRPAISSYFISSNVLETREFRDKTSGGKVGSVRTSRVPPGIGRCHLYLAAMFRALPDPY